MIRVAAKARGRRGRHNWAMSESADRCRRTWFLSSLGTDGFEPGCNGLTPDRLASRRPSRLGLRALRRVEFRQLFFVKHAVRTPWPPAVHSLIHRMAQNLNFVNASI